MDIKEQLRQFGLKNAAMRDGLLIEHLKCKYAPQFFKDHGEEFKRESLAIGKALIEQQPPEVRDYLTNHGPLCLEDCKCRQIFIVNK